MCVAQCNFFIHCTTHIRLDEKENIYIYMDALSSVVRFPLWEEGGLGGDGQKSERQRTAKYLYLRIRIQKQSVV